MFFKSKPKRKPRPEVREPLPATTRSTFEWNPAMPGETQLYMSLLGDNRPAELEIGEHSYGPLELLFNPGDSMAKLKVGRYGSFGTGITVILGMWGRHSYDTATTYPLTGRFNLPPDIIKSAIASKDLSVEIGSDVWIGRNATIMAGVKIGHGAVIGTESLVTKDIEPYTIVGGNPAQAVRKRFSDEIIARMLAIEWWNWTDEDVLRNAAALQTNDMETAIVLLEDAAIRIKSR